MVKLILALLTFSSLLSAAEIIVGDTFKRYMNDRAITLVDWEGYMANPAIKIWLYGPHEEVPPTPPPPPAPAPGAPAPPAAPPAPPFKSIYPITVTLTTSSSRIYFNRDAKTEANRSTKTVVIRSEAAPEAVYLAPWPDRDSRDKEYSLEIASRDSHDVVARFDVKLLVKDEDIDYEDAEQHTVKRERAYPFLKHPKTPYITAPSPFYSERPGFKSLAPFNIALDVSFDPTGFFETKPHALVTTRRALDDWSYFFVPLDVDITGIGEEETALLKFTKREKPAVGSGVAGAPSASAVSTVVDRVVKNRIPFKDLLFYLVASDEASDRVACASSSNSGVMRKGNKTYALKRSSQVLISLAGLGLKSEYDEDRYWAAKYSQSSSKDLYSIILHEGGHALGLSAGNEVFGGWHRSRATGDAALEYYFGRPVRVNAEQHFVHTHYVANGSGGSEETDEPEIDPTSLMPSFGGVKGTMQFARFAITKTDLLALRAVGYRMKNVSAFRELEIAADVPEQAALQSPYRGQVRGRGGIAVYDYRVVEGELPAGIVLDRFTGEFSGAATVPGLYNFVVEVRDHSLKSVTSAHTIAVPESGRSVFESYDTKPPLAPTSKYKLVQAEAPARGPAPSRTAQRRDTRGDSRAPAARTGDSRISGPPPKITPASPSGKVKTMKMVRPGVYEWE